MHPEQLSLRTSFQLEDTADLTVSGVQKLVLVCETRPRTEQFRQHGLINLLHL